VPTEIGFAAALARSIATLYRSTSSSEKSRSTMNQADLIAHVADAAGLSKTDASKAMMRFSAPYRTSSLPARTCG
jgi:hypothetical protein